MKIYRGTTKRIAKKKLGKDWKSILRFSKMKVGELGTPCTGYNERIADIQISMDWQGLSTGFYISDFIVIFESGTSCSALNCCTYPAATKSELIDHWKGLMKTYKDPYFFGKVACKIYELIKNDIEPFEDDGTLKKEYFDE